MGRFVGKHVGGAVLGHCLCQSEDSMDRPAASALSVTH